MSTSLIRRRFRFFRAWSEHAHTTSTSTRCRLDTCRHMYGNLLHLLQPIAVLCAGPSWQPLWGSPNIAMAYVHMNWREWRRLFYTMMRLIAYETPSNWATERRNDTKARLSDVWKIHFLYRATQNTEKGKKTSEGCNAGKCSLHWRGRTMLEAHKVWVTCSSTRGLNIYLFVTQGSLSLQLKVLYCKQGVSIGVENAQPA